MGHPAQVDNRNISRAARIAGNGYHAPRFPLFPDGAEGDAGSAGKLAEIEGLPDVAVEHGKDGTARAAEEGFGEDGGCTHFGVMCTRNGYGGARGFGAVSSTPLLRKEKDRGYVLLCFTKNQYCDFNIYKYS